APPTTPPAGRSSTASTSTWRPGTASPPPCSPPEQAATARSPTSSPSAPSTHSLGVNRFMRYFARGVVLAGVDLAQKLSPSFGPRAGEYRLSRAHPDRPPCQDRYRAHLQDGSTDPSPVAAADLGLSARGRRCCAGRAAALDPGGATAPAAEPVGHPDTAGGHAAGAAAVEPVLPGHDPGPAGHRRAGGRCGSPCCPAVAPGAQRRVHRGRGVPGDGVPL